MAGKKPRPALGDSTASARRKRTIVLTDLRKASRYLASQAGRLDGLAAQMDEHDLKEIHIDGQGLFRRGVDEIDRFIDNVSKGISQAKRDKERASLL
jgi:hypothetical protein